MRIYFEDYQYPPHLLEEYFGKMLEVCDDKVKTRYVGYVYNRDKYYGPIFILPKALLLHSCFRFRCIVVSENAVFLLPISLYSRFRFHCIFNFRSHYT